MKKMILALAMILSMSTIYAFTGEEAVNKQAVSAFQKSFANAKDAMWTVGGNYYKVSFVVNDQQLFAYYSMNGEFMAVTKYISSFNLPLYLQTGLKKQMENYWISDLFEVSDENGTSYYVTLENADTKVVLKATGAENWSQFSKIKKS